MTTTRSREQRSAASAATSEPSALGSTGARVIPRKSCETGDHPAGWRMTLALRCEVCKDTPFTHGCGTPATRCFGISRKSA
jgi:hypothetical protein